MSHTVFVFVDERDDTAPFTFASRDDARKYARALGYGDEQLDEMYESGHGVREFLAVDSFDGQFVILYAAVAFALSRQRYNAATDRVERRYRLDDGFGKALLRLFHRNHAPSTTEVQQAGSNGVRVFDPDPEMAVARAKAEGQRLVDERNKAEKQKERECRD